MSKKDLDNIKNKEPFRVPDQYFDTLTDQIMNSLPDVEHNKETPIVSLWDKVKPLAYLAAMFIGAALIIRILMPSQDSYDGIAYGVDIENVTDEFIQETIDGAMLDSYSMHVYLTDEEY